MPRRSPPTLSDRFDAALRMAVGVHRCDTRKGKSTPYVSHLLGVCSLVLQHGGTEDEAIGALLHDTLEDHPEIVSPEEIRRQFGAKVLSIVRSCTDTPPGFQGGEKPPWRERKRAYIAHLARAGRSAQLVSLADKLYNLREINADLRADGRQTLARFSAGASEQSWYFRGILKALRTSGYSGPLLREFAQAVNEFRRLAR